MIKKILEVLVCDLIIQLPEENVTASGASMGRPSRSTSQLSRLEVKHSQHWLSKGKQYLKAQKIPAAAGPRAFKSPYFKG
jgi:hypothetical protein